LLKLLKKNFKFTLMKFLYLKYLNFKFFNLFL
jgi:hypothetical protein